MCVHRQSSRHEKNAKVNHLAELNVQRFKVKNYKRNLAT